jgi:isopenicillin-N N-acyltransferase like protein
MSTMKTLVLKGDPRVRGLAHGEEFRKGIHELAQIRRGLLRKYLSHFSVLQMDELCLAHVHYLKKIPPLFLEFSSIAEAAQISLTDLMILNNYTDLRDFQKEAPKLDVGGCSCISVRSKAAQWAGQTWDMHASATDYMVHLSIRPKYSEPKQEILTVMGCLALSGFNEYGVGILINNLHTSRARLGLMWPALVRCLLLQPSEHKAVDYLKHHLPSSGHNYMVVGPRSTFNIETTGLESDLSEEMQLGAALHTNHYLGVLRKYENRSKVSPTSHSRLSELNRYFSNPEVMKKNSSLLEKEIFKLEKVKSICIRAKMPQPRAAVFSLI